MKAYPHVYQVGAQGSAAGTISLTSAALPDLPSAPPPEFDGPGGVWSPETLLVASVASCFLLTFRSLARLGRLEWVSLDAATEGLLERIEGTAQFTRFTTRATLRVVPGADKAKAREMLERAEKICLIANSLRGERHLEASVVDMAP